MPTNLTPDGVLIKPLEQFPGYGVTADGRVWSRWRNNGKMAGWQEKSQTMHHSGYPMVTLKGWSVFTHRLIAKAFLPNDPCRHTVNHINGDKTANVWCNLEWATVGENTKHAVDLGLCTPPALPPRFGAANHASKLDADKASAIREAYRAGGIRQVDLAMQFGVSQPSISAVLRGKTWA